MDPELNRYILMNEAKGLVPGYPQSMLDIMGKCNIAAVHGSTHKYMRGSLLSLVSPTFIRGQLLPKIDQFMRVHLSGWDNQVINIQEKTKEVCQVTYFFLSTTFLYSFSSLFLICICLIILFQMAFLSSLKQLASAESGLISLVLQPEFFKLVLGTLSLPIDLPGTNYRSGVQVDCQTKLLLFIFKSF